MDECLPYIDTGANSDALLARAERLIEDEMRKSGGPDLSAHQNSFANDFGHVRSPWIWVEPQTGVSALPQESSSVGRSQNSHTGVELRYAYGAHELLNLELQKRHEENLLRNLNNIETKTLNAAETEARKIEDRIKNLNKKRCREQETAAPLLQAKRRQVHSLMESIRNVRTVLSEN